MQIRKRRVCCRNRKWSFQKPETNGERRKSSVKTMTEWANVFEKAKHMCRYLFEKSKLTRDRLFGVADGENDFAAFRIAVIELFPDSIICSFRTRSSVKRNDHFTNGSRTLSETGSQIANVLTMTAMRRLKKLTRYLLGTSDVYQEFCPDPHAEILQVPGRQ